MSPSELAALASTPDFQVIATRSGLFFWVHRATSRLSSDVYGTAFAAIQDAELTIEPRPTAPAGFLVVCGRDRLWAWWHKETEKIRSVFPTRAAAVADAVAVSRSGALVAKRREMPPGYGLEHYAARFWRYRLPSGDVSLLCGSVEDAAAGAWLHWKFQQARRAGL